jgi:hypothetical protein
MKLRKVEVKALELLSMQGEPLTSVYFAVFERLIRHGLAERTAQGYQITATGCDWLSRHVASANRDRRPPAVQGSAGIEPAGGESKPPIGGMR